MTRKRADREGLEWIKLLFEILYGLLMSAFYVAKEIFELFAPPPGKSLVGQHVLVTGAARGLGRELCIQLAREGCRITCVDVQIEGCQETADMVNATNRGSTATAYRCDITNREDIAKLVVSIPSVDVLINNAGIVSSSSILEVTEEHIEKLMQVNVLAHFWMIRAILPGMIERGRGHIVGIASAAAFTAAANISPYAATKYAVTGMMASLREELRKTYPNIHLTTVHPFFISPPPSCVEHWDKTSRLPDVTAIEVARRTVKGVKRNKATITIPVHLYYLLYLLLGIPTEAGDIWRDMFYANISPLKKDNKATSNGAVPERKTNGLRHH